VPLAQRVFLEQDVQLQVRPLAEDGTPLVPDQTVLEISGSLGSILTAERCALNFLQHLSGIATLTARFVEALRGTQCRILDTRKTIPGLRHLAKYAVRCGGGSNHRFGLYDMFMVKDNHLAAYGGYPDQTILTDALAKARSFDPDARIEIEADTLDQVRLFAELGVDRILLDNMTLDQTVEAVQLVNGRCELEASGNMTLERVRQVAETGVDFISVGALTHSVRALDFSLEVGQF
jgi:nicotinate-nucleotide pyrophosphorylase (carboxylating)